MFTLLAIVIGTSLAVWLFVMSRQSTGTGSADLGRMSPQWMAELKSDAAEWRR